MKRVLTVIIICIGLFLLINALAGGGVTAIVDAARSKSVAEGWAMEELTYINSDFSTGWAGFCGSGIVDFQVAETAPPKMLRVELRRYINLLGWHPTSISELPTNK